MSFLKLTNFLSQICSSERTEKLQDMLQAVEEPTHTLAAHDAESQTASEKTKDLSH